MSKASGELPGKNGRLRSFYDIHDNGDGTADIYLDGGVVFPETDDITGATDYDCLARVVKGVVIYDGLEEDIRRNYEKWFQEAEVIWL